MFVRLHQRECIVRLFDGKKYILPMKLHVVDVARWGYKPSMELSSMDASHDTNDAEGKPPVAQYGSGRTQPPSQGEQAPVNSDSTYQQSSGASASYRVQYGAAKKQQPPEYKEKGEGQESPSQEENEKMQEGEGKKPAFSDELMGMKLEEDSPIQLRDDEAPHEEEASEEDISDKEKKLALEDDPAYKPVSEDEEFPPEQEEEKPAEENEETPAEEESPVEEEEAPALKKPARKHKPIYMPEYEPVQEPEEHAEKPARRKGKNAKVQDAPDEQAEERSLLQKEEDEDASLAEKLSRIREKAAARARVRQPEVSMPEEDVPEPEKEAPTIKSKTKVAKPAAKKPAAPSSKKPSPKGKKK